MAQRSGADCVDLEIEECGCCRGDLETALLVETWLT